MQRRRETVTHGHTHLTIFVNGQARVIPYGDRHTRLSGGADATRPLRRDRELLLLAAHPRGGRHHPCGVPSTTETFTLGQFFAEWGLPLSSTQVGPATGKLTVFFASTGKKPQPLQGQSGGPAAWIITRSRSTLGRRSSNRSTLPTGATSNRTAYRSPDSVVHLTGQEAEDRRRLVLQKGEMALARHQGELGPGEMTEQ